ncbi:hypothetical protein KC717_02725 [Candidatus Dojkabacteria bacterium]|uniref:Uncharacterized protein n=1 Tax=Candidatus Dojkabacteria bacterium TaxID=2099670 RepID=A0A955L8D1_9BACT|nr:hypothetical protein [Candidatus Dojkabacteria bacterium]
MKSEQLTTLEPQIVQIQTRFFTNRTTFGPYHLNNAEIKATLEGDFDEQWLTIGFGDEAKEGSFMVRQLKDGLLYCAAAVLKLDSNTSKGNEFAAFWRPNDTMNRDTIILQRPAGNQPGFINLKPGALPDQINRNGLDPLIRIRRGNTLDNQGEKAHIISILKHKTIAPDNQEYEIMEDQSRIPHILNLLFKRTSDLITESRILKV